MRKYTFILGAGASVDFGFPTGPDFVTKILNCYTKENLEIENSTYLGPDSAYYQDFGTLTDDYVNISYGYSFKLLNELGFDEKEVFSFTNRLTESKVNSIDSFLESSRNRDLLELGKAILAILILSYERASVVHFHKNNWLKYFWNRCKDEILGNDPNVKIEVISFNYDRLFEHYLYTAIESYTGNTENEIEAILDRFRIFHVHGSIGSLPFQSNEKSVSYGQEFLDVISLKEIVNNIALLGEADSKSRSKSSAILATYFNLFSTTFFLGFGFHKENLERLIAKIKQENYHFQGTSFGMGSAEIRDAEFRINKTAGVRVILQLERSKIEKFLQDHLVLEGGPDRL